MAVHDRNRDVLPKRFQSFSDQDLVWLWSVLGRDFTISHPESFKNPLGLAESCAKALESKGEAYAVWRQLSCPVRDNYDGRLGGLTFYSFQPA